MPFQQSDSLRYFQFELFQSPALHQGIFTRQGGVSPEPWASLNTGGLSGDARENVVENRRRIFNEYSLPVETIFDVWQVHSAEVVMTTTPRPLDSPHQQSDAILTNRPGITLFMRFGDCVPIFLWDPVKKVIGLVHAGWPGTVGRIVQNAVAALKEGYGSRPADLMAGIGPSICVHHYEVKDDVIAKVQACMGSDASQVLVEEEGRVYLDLWRTNQIQLRQAGIPESQIELSGICTAENPQDWYSHRGDHGKTGRFGALLALK